MFRLLNLVASCLLITGLGLACASWLGVPRLREITEAGRFLLDQYERTETLRQHRLATLQCYEGKRRVTEEVVAGRLGLLEAAAEFRRLHAPLEDGYDPVTGISRGPISDKYLCWNVLGWVRDRCEGTPDQGAAILDRLRNEYREHFHEEPNGPNQRPSPR
jgi:hypothetical protein